MSVIKSTALKKAVQDKHILIDTNIILKKPWTKISF